jgi:hypothetical protein
VRSLGYCDSVPEPAQSQPRPRDLEAAPRQRLNERLRAEFIAGAEMEWRKRSGRPMTAEELQRVLRRYPGDV